MFSSQVYIYDYELLLLLMNQKHVLQDYDKLSYQTIQASYDSWKPCTSKLWFMNTMYKQVMIHDIPWAASATIINVHVLGVALITEEGFR